MTWKMVKPNLLSFELGKKDLRARIVTDDVGDLYDFSVSGQSDRCNAVTLAGTADTQEEAQKLCELFMDIFA